MGRLTSALQARSPYFNPPTPCGVGLRASCFLLLPDEFQSTHPVWGGTYAPRRSDLGPEFQSTHPVWGGTDNSSFLFKATRISIHPPRVGWDYNVSSELLTMTYFNPPTPCGVGLLSFEDIQNPKWISIHPPRVGWDSLSCWISKTVSISIHPPRVGWDRAEQILTPENSVFQSTHPVWGGTCIP